MPLFTNEDVVTGSVDANVTNASIAVTGPLTDTQLRATPVPVSGTVSTGGLTDTQLRATPIPVSGTVTATGPLTDTQLRATPVPVTSGSLSTAVVTSATVSPVVATVLASVSTRAKFILYNEAGTLYVKLGTGATSSDYSMRLTANAAWEFSGYSGVVTAIKASGTTALLVTSIQ